MNIIEDIRIIRKVGSDFMKPKPEKHKCSRCGIETFNKDSRFCFECEEILDSADKFLNKPSSGTEKDAQSTDDEKMSTVSSKGVVKKKLPSEMSKRVEGELSPSESLEEKILNDFAQENQYNDWKSVINDKQSLCYSAEDFEIVVKDIIRKTYSEIFRRIDEAFESDVKEKGTFSKNYEALKKEFLK